MSVAGTFLPRRSDRRDRDVADVVGVGRELDAQPFVGQQLRDRVAPLDEQHALAVLELVEREIDHVLLALEPIEVDVRHRHPPAHVLAHQREGRRGDVLGRAEPARDPLDEGGLARPELTGQHDDVVGAQHAGKGSADVARVLGGRGADRKLHRQNSSSWSSGGGASVRP